MWHWMPLTVSTPLSDPRRPFLIVSPSRDGRRGLADDARVDALAPRLQLAHDGLRAVDTGALLVRREEQRQRPAVIRRAGDESLGGRDHRGHRHLHVGGAAAEQVAVALGGRERIARPPLDRARRHDVDVPGQADERRGRATARPEVADRRRDPSARTRTPRPPAARRAAPGSRRRRASASGRRSAASRGRASAGGRPARRRCEPRSGQARSSSLIDVLARVASSTRFTMTAQASEYLPSADGRLPGTTTEPDGTRP